MSETIPQDKNVWGQPVIDAQTQMSEYAAGGQKPWSAPKLAEALEIHKGLIYKTAATHYRNLPIEWDDRIQEAYIETIGTIERHDPDKGTFGSFVIASIPFKIKEVARETSSTISVPVHAAKSLMEAAKKHYGLDYITTSDIEEFFAENNSDAQTAKFAYRALRHVFSLSEIDDLDDLEIEDENVNEEIREIENSFDTGVFREKFRSVFSGVLDERELNILFYRFGLYDNQAEPMTLEEIGKIFSLTRQRIQQIESKVFSKLKHPSTVKYFKKLGCIEDKEQRSDNSLEG